MNLNDLTKEQKQYIFLGVLGVAVVLGGIYFGIRASLQSSSKAKQELAALTENIKKADRAVSRRMVSGVKFEETKAVLKAHLANMPPVRNSSSWAAEVIYAVARQVGVEVDAVEEQVRIMPEKKNKKKKANVSLELYALRVTAHGSFEDARHFLTELKKSRPLARFGGIEINAGSQPERHDIQFYIAWPISRGELTEVWQAIEKKLVASGMRPVAVPKTEAGKQVQPEREPVVRAAPVPAEQPIETAAPVAAVPAAAEPTAASVTPPPAVADNLNVNAASNGTSANKLETILMGQAQKDEETWNKFMGSLEGGAQ